MIFLNPPRKVENRNLYFWCDHNDKESWSDVSAIIITSCLLHSGFITDDILIKKWDQTFLSRLNLFINYQLCQSWSSLNLVWHYLRSLTSTHLRINKVRSKWRNAGWIQEYWDVFVSYNYDLDWTNQIQFLRSKSCENYQRTEGQSCLK